MKHRTTPLRVAAVLATAAASTLLGARDLGAQAWAYPSFQPPQAVAREYNFSVADADGAAGTSFIFQWREGISLGNQLSLDAGFADPDCVGCNTRLVVGGQFAHQLAVANSQMPFDMLFTGGLGATIGSGSNLVRIPVGLSIGHRFPLEGGMAITPYAHPRLSLDICSSCGNNRHSDTNLGLDFDLGGSFEFSPQFSLRLSALFSGSDYADNAFGVSLAWRPPGLRR